MKVREQISKIVPRTSTLLLNWQNVPRVSMALVYPVEGSAGRPFPLSTPGVLPRSFDRFLLNTIDLPAPLAFQFSPNPRTAHGCFAQPPPDLIPIFLRAAF